MKFISFFFLLIIIFNIKSQQQNNNSQEQQQPSPNNNSNNSNIEQQNKNQGDPEQKNLTQNQNQTQNVNNSTNAKNEEVIKKDTKDIEENKNETKEEKAFNLTEALVKFFKDTFEKKNNTEEKKSIDNNDTNAKINEEIEKRRKEAERQQQYMQERERKRREAFEARTKAELIRIENQKKEEKRKKEKEEKHKFENMLANTTFDEIIQINLDKGETETLYFDSNSFNQIKMAVLLTDEEEKVNFAFSGPNSRGRTSVLYNVRNKNYLYYEYETLRKGEYIIEITNVGSKENELVFLLKDNRNKKKDNINTEKIDKITMLLTNIDNNINQLRTKKKFEIRQISSHNEKVISNNKSIVIYSIIEIFTMIIIFIAQSYYISSIVNKV